MVAVSEIASPPAGAGFMAFGSFVFDPDNSAASSALVVPQTVIGRRHGRSWMTQIGTRFRHDPLDAPRHPPADPAACASPTAR